MADDLNVLAGLEGLLGGVASTAVPLLTKRMTLRDLADLEARKEHAAERASTREERRRLALQKELKQFEHDLMPEGTFYRQDEAGNILPTDIKTGTRGNQVIPFRAEPGDPQLVSKRFTELSGAYSEARKRKSVVPIIDKMLDLIDKEGVTGKGGQVKAFLAPYAEAAGITSKELQNAQTYEVLTRLLAGPARLDLVGSGQVSNFEQDLLSKLSGGGGTAKEAARGILEYNRGLAKDRIDTFNELLESSKVLSPKFAKLYSKIEYEQRKRSKDSGPPLPSRRSVVRSGQGWRLLRTK